MHVVSHNLRVAINRRERHYQLTVARSQAEAQRSQKLRSNQILVAPCTNVKPLRIAASQLSTLKDGVIVQVLGVRLEDDRTLAVGQDEARLAEAVLPRVGDVLLRTQHLHPILLGQGIIDCRLLLANRYVRILRKAHNRGLWILHCRLHNGIGCKARLSATIATTHQKLRVRCH